MLLTDGEELQRTILNAPIGICILNVDTLIAEVVNDKFLEVAGKPYESIHGKFYWDAFAEARPYYEAALQGVVSTGEAYYADEVELMLIRHGNEEMIFVTFVYAPVKDKDGKVTKVAVWVLENTRQVAERKKEVIAKLAFQQERDRLKSFLMQAPAGICILIGPELTFELANPAYQQFLPGRDLVGRSIFEAIPELVGTPLEDILLSVYQKGEPVEMNELLIPVAEYVGGPMIDRYFSFTYQPWRDENDQVEGILAIVFEVTRMINSQQQLEHQKRLYEAITSGTPDLMYVWDLEYRFTYANTALLTMWGKTWETAIGVGLRENGYEEWHAQMHEREIDSIIATKQPVRGEVAFPHAVLGRRVYDYILVPVINDQGKVVAVAGTTRDVSDRKLMEDALAHSSEELQAINEEMAATNEEQAASNEELKATNHELALVNQQLSAARQQIEESETTLRLAIDAANFGTWFIHSVTREFITDARLKELFGYYPDEALSIEQALAQITDEYRGFVTNKLENAIYNGGDYDVTYPVTGLHDQQLRWLRAVGNLKTDPSGAFSAFTGVVMDVTEQHLDEQRKNDFIGMVSHELKTPLTSLNAYLQMLQLKAKKAADDFTSGALEQSVKQVKRMTTMINGFLNVSRLESGQIHIDKICFDMAELIKETEAETLPMYSSHEVVFAPVAETFVFADRDKIGQVVNNLISNAVKYSKPGTKINVACVTVNGNAEVRVSDQGIGIQPDDINRLFERYYRVKNDGHVSGFGIGLYLSAEIIKRHEGKIWAVSKTGLGSTFFFSLPVA